MFAEHTKCSCLTASQITVVVEKLKAFEKEYLFDVIMAEKKKYKTRVNWTQMNEDFLVELWEEKISDLRGVRKNTHIYKEMSLAFEKRNVFLAPEEIKIKIHNLTNKYRKEKKDIGPSGGSPSTWPLFNRIHAIIGGLRIHNLDAVVTDSITTESEQDIIYNDMSSSVSIAGEWFLDEPIEEVPEAVLVEETAFLSPRPAKKQKKESLKTSLSSELRAADECIQNHLQEMIKSDLEFLKVEHERNEIFTRYVTSSEKFQNDVINLLSK